MAHADSESNRKRCRSFFLKLQKLVNLKEIFKYKNLILTYIL